MNQSFDEGTGRYKIYTLIASPPQPQPTPSLSLSDNTTASKNPTGKLTMSSHHGTEIERYSLSACTVLTNKYTALQKDETNNNDNNNTTDQWNWIDDSSASLDPAAATTVPTTKLSNTTSIRIAPMEWNCGGWAEEHFHEQLKLPPSSSNTPSKGIIVKLEAKARECVAVALSPQPYFVLGKSYAIHIGAASNLQTVIRRRLMSQTEAVDITMPTPKICSNEKYVSFWIILQSNGQLSVGIGKNPGKNCVATLDDSMYHALRSGVDAVKYVGLGNSTLGRKARDLKVRKVQVMSIPSCFENSVIPLTQYDPLARTSNDDEMNGNGHDNDVAKEDSALWAEYQKECEKAKVRAKKFNVEYKQPPLDAFFKWSEARRLRANPERGFITGLDIMSNEEKEKAGKRKERFEEEDRTNKAIANNNNTEDGNGDGNGEDDDEMEGNNIEEDNDQVGKKREPLPLEQAWDNLDLVKDLRVDPPPHLQDGSKEPAISMNNDDNNTMNDEDECTTTAAVHVPEKIHLFAIDWAAFKQIRTDDIMSYFSVYGPSYVEWLGELSCNVLFADKYSASRAMEGMSRALPNVIPTSLITKIDSDVANNDSMGVDATDDTGAEGAANTEEGDPTAATTSNGIDKEGIPQSTENDKSNNPSTSSSNEMANLGVMGWRFCNYPIRKIQDDRFGKRGTRSRFLMRLATSLDVLEERPSSWPAPPPGFTTKRILGPGSDFKKFNRKRNNERRRERGSKRRRRSFNSYEEKFQDQEIDDSVDERMYQDRVLDALDIGLKASR